jgi:hypothetical protein
MGISYYLHYSCVPCSLCSVPVFHWFHVPNSCVLVCIFIHWVRSYRIVGLGLSLRKYPETIELIYCLLDRGQATRDTSHHTQVPNSARGVVFIVKDNIKVLLHPSVVLLDDDRHRKTSNNNIL